MTDSTHPLIAGFLGGVVSTTLLLPLDVIKVRWRSGTYRYSEHFWKIITKGYFSFLCPRYAYKSMRMLEEAISIV